MKYYIETFGCQANKADSERLATALESRGMITASTLDKAGYVVINTCVVRLSAENRVYGLVNKLKSQSSKPKIILTGCMVGLALKDKTGKQLQILRRKLPEVDEFLPMEEVGFDTSPLRSDKKHAWVPISNGCNNFCTYCVVPYTRGREASRPFEDIVAEGQKLKDDGYTQITLVGQNVNSYGSDLIKAQSSKLTLDGREVEPVLVKHLGRYRIPTLFPYLLEKVAKMGFARVDFLSANPWDFSDELIEVIARNTNITRTIHLPVQSGDDEILKKMKRWYTVAQYLALISKVKSSASGDSSNLKIPNVNFTTDIIVGFPGETEEQFQHTVELCESVGFSKAYISMYSPRPLTASAKLYKDDVPHAEKKRRFRILDELINKSV